MQSTVQSTQEYGVARELATRSPLAQFPEVLQVLFKPKRWKGIYGGRGAGRSWGCARASLLLQVASPYRMLCARELQKSIKDSVHKLIRDQITRLEMNYLFEVTQAAIIGRPGTQCTGAEYSFEGLRHNADQIKSYEGVKRCWVEESDKTSDESWEVLIPTIRAEESEIWATWNTRLVSDPIYAKLVTSPPGSLVSRTVDPVTGAISVETSMAFVVKNSFRDNPWFPEVLRAEMEELRAKDYAKYLEVWEGMPKLTVEGAVYKEELRELYARQGVREVPYDPSVGGVDVFFDIGMGHYTAAWFVQRSMWEHRYLRFYKNRMQNADHYVQYLQKLPYSYDTIWLPHDASAKRFGTKLTVEEQFRERFPQVKIVPRLSIEDGINALKTIFPNAYFDAANCAEGLADLANYAYEIDPVTKTWSSRPDQSSEAADAADAARYSAVGSGVKKRRRSGVVEAVARVLMPPTQGEISAFGRSGSGFANGSGTGWLGG